MSRMEPNPLPPQTVKPEPPPPPPSCNRERQLHRALQQHLEGERAAVRDLTRATRELNQLRTENERLRRMIKDMQRMHDATKAYALELLEEAES